MNTPVSSPVIFRLSDRRDLITKISQVVKLDIDLDNDITSGYPGVICRSVFFCQHQK